MQINTLPLLPLRDIVLFPGVVMPISVRRPQSIKSTTEALKATAPKKRILITAQRSIKDELPSSKDLYDVGVLCEIVQTVRLSDEVSKIIVRGAERVRLVNVMYDDYFIADYEIFEQDNKYVDGDEFKRKMKLLTHNFEQYVLSTRPGSTDLIKTVLDQDNEVYVPNMVATHIVSDVALQQKILEANSIIEQIDILQEYLVKEFGKIRLQREIEKDVQKNMEKHNRDAYLYEQRRVIDKKLDGDGGKSEYDVIKSKIDSVDLSKEAKEKAISELKKLRITNQMSGEYSLIRTYLDTILGMPWGKKDFKDISIKEAEDILDKEHFGLEKIKERIVEYLAVLKRSKQIKGPILCLIGPPGVGKTSLVRSIATALGRKYCKFSLGGMRDEAEVRGHRRTYIGSMPGKIINHIKKAGVDNPVILLDEIDKLSSDFRGDPTSAFLEVLDPEQNHQFEDHYMEVKYSLSDVIFIATANSYSGIPRPLRDRMEIIDISGYSENAKLQIAKNYLVKKQLEQHCMKAGEFSITDDAIVEIIRYYTSESGVRGLERQIGQIIRKALKAILDDSKIETINVGTKDLESYLGIRKYRFGLAEKDSQVGCTTGLAYTEVGGDLLSIEAAIFPGKGEVKTTGKLGEVMTESIHTAYSCFRSKAEKFELKYENFKDLDIHLHFPEGATPKDGPSAGIAIFTTIISILTGSAVKNTVGMTGEITLRGKVLPIGGLKEKLLAAGRGGIKTVLIPQENEKDLQDIPASITEKLKIVPVSNADQVLEHALVH